VKPIFLATTYKVTFNRNVPSMDANKKPPINNKKSFLLKANGRILFSLVNVKGILKQNCLLGVLQSGKKYANRIYK
jgi:hypothetical protein